MSGQCIQYTVTRADEIQSLGGSPSTTVDSSGFYRVCVCFCEPRSEGRQASSSFALHLRQRAIPEAAAHRFSKTMWSANPTDPLVSLSPPTTGTTEL